MTDNEIIKALECCSMGSYPACRDCPYHDDYVNRGCINKRNADIKELINIQKAEIEKKTTACERLEIYMDELVKQKLETAKSEAIKEFAERLTDRICENVNRSLDNPDGNNYYPIDVYKDIDNLAKEMT